MKIIAMLLLSLLLVGCSSISTEIIAVNEEYHKFVLDNARIKMKYVSCDIGLIDGLGLTSSVDFPIKTTTEAKALLNNPAISLIISQMKDIAKTTIDPQTGRPYWNQEHYQLCQVEGLGLRAAALSVIDILRLFPQLSPYLSIFAK